MDLVIILLMFVSVCEGQKESKCEDQSSGFYKFGLDIGDSTVPTNDDGSVGPLDLDSVFPFYGKTHSSVIVSTNGAVSFLRDVPEYIPRRLPLGEDKRLILPFWSDVDTSNHSGRIYYHEIKESLRTNAYQIPRLLVLFLNLNSGRHTNLPRHWWFLSKTTLFPRCPSHRVCNFKYNYSNLPQYPGYAELTQLVKYRGRGELNVCVRKKAKDDIVDKLKISFTPSLVFVVTWHDVTYHMGGDAKNTFQVALITDGSKSFVSFHYGDMTWASGALSDIPAVAGLNAGDGINFETLPDSGTENILRLSNSMRIYRTDAPNSQSGCTEDFTGELRAAPRFGHFLGGKKISISGPCYAETDVIQCKFGEFVVDGRVIDSRTAECISPFMGSTGTFSLTMSLNGGQDFRFHGQFLYVLHDPTKEVVRYVTSSAWTATGTGPLGIHWNRNHLNTTHVNITFVMFGYDENGNLSNTEVLIKSNRTNTPNRGGDIVQFSWEDPETQDDLPAPSFGAIRVSPAALSEEGLEYLWSDIHNPGWYVRFFLKEAATFGIQNEEGTAEASQDVQDAWNKIKDLFNNMGYNLDSFNTQTELETIIESYFSPQCDDWVAKDTEDPPDFSDVSPPPCRLDQAHNDPMFVTDSACTQVGNICGLHPGAHQCVKSRRASANGAAQQACYAKDGNLLPFREGGGTMDRSGVVSWSTVRGFSAPPPNSVINHILHDVQPFYICCSWSSNCMKFSGQRPTRDCMGYLPPATGTGFGDPHIFTLDGFEYTFNGLGEYVLLHIPSIDLVVQARTGQAVNGTGFKLPATEWTALVMKMSDSSTIQVHFDEILSLLVVLVDGVIQQLDDIVTTVDFNGGSIIRSEQENSTVFLIILSGASFQIKEESATRLSFIIQLSSRLKGSSSGLLGVWNDDKTDDLLAANGTTLDDTASLESIFYDFGESWRVTEDTSLFHYGSFESYSTFNDLTFRPVFPSADALESTEALKLCGRNRLCLFDFLASGGDGTLAQQAMQNGQIYQTIIQNTQPVVTCGFPTYQSNVNADINGSLVGAVVEFTCNNGQFLSGTSSIFCQQDGTWSAESPVCREVIDGSNGNGNVLFQSITGGIAGVILLAFVIAAPLYACHLDKARHKYQRQRHQQYWYPERPAGLYSNTKTHTYASTTGYLRPYSYYTHRQF